MEQSQFSLACSISQKGVSSAFQDGLQSFTFITSIKEEFSINSTGTTAVHIMQIA